MTKKVKQFTKKFIQSVLKTGNRTRIWHLYFKVTGERPTRSAVYNFVRNNAPTIKVSKKAFDIAYWGINRHHNNGKGGYDYYRVNVRHITMNTLRDEIARGVDNYTKRPIMGKTHLYFASPLFGHEDYNKTRMLRIEGNERFCELICKVADKYIPMQH